MSRTVADRRTSARGIGERCASALLLVIVSLWIVWPSPGATQGQSGTLILVGDVLRFNQRSIWNRIAGNAADLTIVAAAHDRPKLYGEFARRALQRHGAFAELLPLAVDSSEFGIDYRGAVTDRALLDKVREASGVFFVGGAPQRLAQVLLRADGSPSPIAQAVAEVYASGGVIVGGIPGSIGLSTGLDALEVLARGRVSPAHLHRGLGLVGEGWFVDQHAFTAGRLAEILVAMRQLGVTRGLGVGADTAAVIEDAHVEVVGGEGVLLIDLSEGRSIDSAEEGSHLAGARLSYLEDGDRLDMSTLEVTPAAIKLDGFEIDPDEAGGRSSEPARPVAGSLLAKGRLLPLLREALDGAGHEAVGFAYREDAPGDGRGFRFRFHAVAETFGWLSVDSGMDRYTIVNVGLEISPVAHDDIPDP